MHPFTVNQPAVTRVQSVSYLVSYFTVPPRAHPSACSPSGSAAPVQTQVPSTRVLSVYNFTLSGRVVTGIVAH